MAAEQELAKYLDDAFYAPMIAAKKLSSVQRIYDVEQQKRGIDVIASKEKHTAYIDEKAQLYYINKRLPTFAFELGFSTESARHTGWLLNDELATTHYFLLWISAETSSLAQFSKEKITSVEGIMIRKSDLRKYLDEHGLDYKTLSEVENKLHEKAVTGRHDSPIDGIYFYVSDKKKYSEAPVNLVIGKKILLSIASGHYQIVPKGYRELKT